MNAAPKYYGFPARSYGDYTFGHEKMRDMTMEFRRLNEEEAAHSEAIWLSFKPKIDYAAYLEWDKNNTFVIFTIRHKGTLVGNIMYFLRPHPNMGGVLGATDNGIYIKPAFRKGRVAMEALKYAEECLMSVGVKYVVHGDKAPCGGEDLSNFFKRQGYRPFSTLYVKELGIGE